MGSIWDVRSPSLPNPLCVIRSGPVLHYACVYMFSYLAIIILHVVYGYTVTNLLPHLIIKVNKV